VAQFLLGGLERGWTAEEFGTQYEQLQDHMSISPQKPCHFFSLYAPQRKPFQTTAICPFGSTVADVMLFMGIIHVKVLLRLNQILPQVVFS